MAPTTLDHDQRSTSTDADDYGNWILQEYQSPDFVSAINCELDRLSLLPPNWDAEGAPPINQDIVEAARSFIARLPKNIGTTPAVVPSAAGNLQFEWNDGPRSLELEVETTSVIHYLKWHPEDGIEEEGFFDIDDADRAVSLIRWFMGAVANV